MYEWLVCTRTSVRRGIEDDEHLASVLLQRQVLAFDRRQVERVRVTVDGVVAAAPSRRCQPHAQREGQERLQDALHASQMFRFPLVSCDSEQVSEGSTRKMRRCSHFCAL